MRSHPLRPECGFSLVELLVGLVVGLIASAAVIQTFSTFEAQKRSTVAGSEAQENGLVAMALLEQDIHNAGAGIVDPLTLDCDAGQTFTWSTLAAGPIPNFSLLPLTITSTGVVTQSDVVQTNTGDFLGALPAYTVSPMVTPNDPLIVSRTANFSTGDLLVVTFGGQCTVMQVSAVNATLVSLKHDPGVQNYNAPLDNGNNSGNDGNGNGNGDNCDEGNGKGNGKGNNGNGKGNGGNGNGNNGGGNCNGGGFGSPVYATGAHVLNPKTITSSQFQVVSGTLQQTLSTIGASPTVRAYSLVRNVAFLKAQYGIAPAGTQGVTTWVNATGPWDASQLATSATKRKQIKAARIVVVTRSDKREAPIVSQSCTNVSGTVNLGPCAWRDTAANPAPTIDLSANPDWQHFRYKVYQTIVPLRNVIWGNV